MLKPKYSDPERTKEKGIGTRKGFCWVNKSCTQRKKRPRAPKEKLVRQNVFKKKENRLTTAGRHAEERGFPAVLIEKPGGGRRDQNNGFCKGPPNKGQQTPKTWKP